MLGWIVAIVLGVVGLFVLACIPHNVRVMRARRAYARVPPELRQEALRLIEAEAAERRACTFMRLDVDRVPDAQSVAESHVGGAPYAESEVNWPDDARHFLLQVRLRDPTLGETWQDRLLLVFLRDEYEQVVRSYAAPAASKHVAIPTPEELTFVHLEAIRIPVDDDGYPWTPAMLDEHVPALHRLLSTFSRDVPGLISQLLRPGVYGYDLETPDIAYVGGTPGFVQQPHEAICRICRKPMRFLFQFGEIIPDLQLADGGVCYVYGCDLHPNDCQAFIDTH
ncbi:MAG TPA: hypothetical protein VGR35_04800 [Tepidisphaeraceae bacterium]|nr:hypothetical protein [Tepidisphaeraceae bacterium]